ncbi:MAG: class I SAM-dependent methyltransferase [Hyphomicrobiales bacterium]|nr:class I SAM-dependent methyltransferase [Hyphomicrobiales bacterium]
MTAELRRYFNGGYRQIEGWLSKSVFSVVDALNISAEKQSVTGGCCEIGVHHGRLFVALLALASKNSKSLAVDLFEDQSLNIDRSGRGEKQIFLDNVSKWAAADMQVTALQADSLSISTVKIIEIAQQFGLFKFFSVDGGHTREHAFHDILVAQELTANGGFILVDDFFSQDWPGVTEGVSRYYNGADTKFAPLCITGNKLFLTSISYHKRYLTELAATLPVGRPNSKLQTIQLYGWPAISFHLAADDSVLLPI